MQRRLDLFEGLLTGREHLFGEFGAADCGAWPFLRYAVAIEPDDDELFHRVLHERMDARRPPSRTCAPGSSASASARRHNTLGSGAPSDRVARMEAQSAGRRARARAIGWLIAAAPRWC